MRIHRLRQLAQAPAGARPCLHLLRVRSGKGRERRDHQHHSLRPPGLRAAGESGSGEPGQDLGTGRAGGGPGPAEAGQAGGLQRLRSFGEEPELGF